MKLLSPRFHAIAAIGACALGIACGDSRTSYGPSRPPELFRAEIALEHAADGVAPIPHVLLTAASGGSDGPFTLSVISSSYDDGDSAAPHPCGATAGQKLVCADVLITNTGAIDLDLVRANIDNADIAPPTGRSAVGPFFYGTLAATHSATRTWTFLLPNSATFTFSGEVDSGTTGPSDSAAALTAFSIPSLSANGTINEGAHTINVAVPPATAVTALVADFTTTGFDVSIGARHQTSGVLANDFTTPVSYVVTASNGSSVTYIVTVGTCAAGAFASGGSCSSCTAVADCVGSVTCTSDSDSQCSVCQAGFFAHSDGVRTSCSRCTDVLDCVGQETCTGISDSSCPRCEDGTWRGGTLPTQCTECTDVTNCLSTLTCTTPSNSQCTTCAPDFFVDASGPASRCTPCSSIPGCEIAGSCTSASNSQCVVCDNGRFRKSNSPGADTCPFCAPIAFCQSTPTCTAAEDSRCSQCAPGHYLDTAGGPPDTCPECPPIANCLSPLPLPSCTNAVTSRCDVCAPGFFLVPGTATTPDTCARCNGVAGCTGSLTCTSATNSVCSACGPGEYLSADGESCPACTTVAGCTSALTCTSANDSQCTACGSGDFLLDGAAGAADACPPCSVVPNCTGSVTCATAADSQCSACVNGEYPADVGGESVCTPCTPVPGCNSSLTCTNGSDSQCTSCISGDYKIEGSVGAADTCAICTAVASCDPDAVTCTSPTDSQCAQCQSGSFLLTGDPERCEECAAINFCVLLQSCTTAVNSECAVCSNGFYLDSSARPTGADACRACSLIPDCVSPNPPRCSSPTNSQCDACAAGFFLVHGVAGAADTCTACTQLEGCAKGVVCTNAGNSTCAS